MKVEARIFEFLTVFFFVVAIVYVILSQEPAGSAALFLTGGLSLIVGTYFRFVARRLEDAARGQPGGRGLRRRGRHRLLLPGQLLADHAGRRGGAGGPLAGVLVLLGAGDLRVSC